MLEWLGENLDGLFLVLEGHRPRALDLVRQVLRPVLEALQAPLPPPRAGPEAHLHALAEALARPEAPPVTLLIQSVDGPALRAALPLLGALAELPRLRLVATALHALRAPCLLPPHPRWVWWQLHTWAQCREEALQLDVAAPSSRARQGLAPAQAVELLRTLSRHQRLLFTLLARTAALTEDALLRIAQDELLGLKGSELRELLRELLDHGLVQQRGGTLSCSLDQAGRDAVLALLRD